MNEREDLLKLSAQYIESCEKIIHPSVLGQLVMTINILIHLTKKMLALRMFNQIFLCMDLVNYLYESGNKSQKIVVEKLYITFLRDLQSYCTIPEWQLIIKNMPGLLFKAYIRSKIESLYI